MPINIMRNINNGALNYKGVLDASEGSYPSSPIKGDSYVISVGGTISGTVYDIKDWAVYNGTSWDKIDNTEPVITWEGVANKPDLIESDSPDFEDNTVEFTLTDNTITDSACTVDWNNGNKQKLDLTSDVTLTFTDPSKACGLMLYLIQDATGSRTITLPSTIKWMGGTAPTFSTDANAVDILSLAFDGTNYYGQAGIGFAEST